MNSITPPNNGTTQHRVEFFRPLAPRKRDPFFGLSRGWYYKAAALGEWTVLQQCGMWDCKTGPWRRPMIDHQEKPPVREPNDR